jgi:hypothetical protein
VSKLLGRTVGAPSSNLNANNSKKIKIENDHSQNITPQQPNVQHVQGSPMFMGYEQFKPPQNNSYYNFL